jgi:hypothetical protein
MDGQRANIRSCDPVQVAELASTSRSIAADSLSAPRAEVSVRGLHRLVRPGYDRLVAKALGPLPANARTTS